MFPMDGILMSLHFIFVVESFFTSHTPELMMCVSMLTQFLYGTETTITEFTGLFVVFIQTCFAQYIVLSINVARQIICSFEDFITIITFRFVVGI